MTEMTHILGKSNEKFVQILQQSKTINWCCQTCGEIQSPSILPFLGGRPIVVGSATDGIWKVLVMCSHCMFHQTNCRTRQSSASFSKLGAPLDQDSANAFIRMLGRDDSNNLVIIVL